MKFDSSNLNKFWQHVEFAKERPSSLPKDKILIVTDNEATPSEANRGSVAGFYSAFARMKVATVYFDNEPDAGVVNTAYVLLTGGVAKYYLSSYIDVSTKLSPIQGAKALVANISDIPVPEGKTVLLKAPNKAAKKDIASTIGVVGLATILKKGVL